MLAGTLLSYYTENFRSRFYANLMLSCALLCFVLMGISCHLPFAITLAGEPASFFVGLIIYLVASISYGKVHFLTVAALNPDDSGSYSLMRDGLS